MIRTRVFFDVLWWSLERDLGWTSSYRDLQNTYGTPKVQGQLIVSPDLTKTVMPPRAETSYANNCPTNNCSYNSSDKLCVYRDARSILQSSVNNSPTTFFCHSITHPAKQFDDIWLTGDYIPKHSLRTTDVIVKNHTIPLKKYNGQQRPNAKLQNELFMYLKKLDIKRSVVCAIQRRTCRVLLTVHWILIVKRCLALSPWGVLTLKRARQSDVI